MTTYHDGSDAQTMNVSPKGFWTRQQASEQTHIDDEDKDDDDDNDNDDINDNDNDDHNTDKQGKSQKKLTRNRMRIAPICIQK